MTVGWGFIGAGWIAQRAMAPAVHHAGNARLQSAASRDPIRTTALEPRAIHQAYESVIEDPDVDVVYVCLANHQHAEWVLRALAAGKHVCCEKPLALDHAQAQSLASAAADAERLLVEAVWCRWHPRFRRLAALSADGQLGDIVAIESAFTFPGQIDDNYRSRPECGGGALLDVGGYQVHAWMAVTDGIAGVAVQRVETTWGSTGIDVTRRVEAVIGESARAEALASFVLPEQQSLAVTGSDTVARMGSGSAFTTWREPSTLLIGEHVETFPPVDAYQLMVEAVSDHVSGCDSWIVPMDQTLRVASVLDEIRALSK
jgi:xylose dehydrogenase (NAD/NADP)